MKIRRIIPTSIGDQRLKKPGKILQGPLLDPCPLATISIRHGAGEEEILRDLA